MAVRAEFLLRVHCAVAGSDDPAHKGRVLGAWICIAHHTHTHDMRMCMCMHMHMCMHMYMLHVHMHRCMYTCTFTIEKQ